MRKEDLVSAVANDLGVSFKKATTMVNSVFEHIGKELRTGQSVCVTGFGTFVSRPKKACRIKTPTGKRMRLPNMKVVTFRTGDNLRKVVRRKSKKLY